MLHFTTRSIALENANCQTCLILITLTIEFNPTNLSHFSKNLLLLKAICFGKTDRPSR
ncbi:MAG: hypothetical protein WBB29_00280 [Geitlerinemataceae cyanobacterium]